MRYSAYSSSIMPVEIKEIGDQTYSFDCGRDPVFELRQVAYILTGETPVIIDPGSTSAAREILDGCPDIGVAPGDFAYIIPTHIHLDHAGGTGFLAKVMPDAKVVLHPKGINHMIDPAKIVQNFRAVFGPDFEDTLGPVLPVPQNTVLPAFDGQEIRLNGRTLTIYFSPGHATHHIAVMDSLTHGLFCGDALGYIADETPDIPFPVGLPPFDPEAYLETIDKLAGLSPDIIFYAHHGAETGVRRLLSMVKMICADYARIIRQALKAGEGHNAINGRIRRYSASHCPEKDIPAIVEASISGYVDFYGRNSR